MEQWSVHPDCDIDTAGWVMRLKPFIMSINQKYPETIYVDMSRIHTLFDEDKKPIQDRWNSDHEFWTKDNPLPLNVIADDEEMLALWPNDPEATVNAIFPQTKETVAWAMKVRNENKNNIIVVCQGTVVVETKEGPQTLPTMTFFSIQLFELKGDPHIIINMEPNSKYGWYCHYCSKQLKNSLRCTRCAPQPSEENQENISKPGTYYCDATCQKADWPTHKLACVHN
jgi:hypothetical protein